MKVISWSVRSSRLETVSLPFTRSKHLMEAMPNAPLPGPILPVTFLQIPPLEVHTHPFPSISRPFPDRIPPMRRGTTCSPHRLFSPLSLSRPSTAIVTCRVAGTIACLQWLFSRRCICHQARRSVEPPSHHRYCWGREQLCFDPPGSEQV